jgi:hypothetical protein
MMADRLYGEDATVSRVLAKIELAVRRSASHMSIDIASPHTVLNILAQELARVQKDMYND